MVCTCGGGRGTTSGVAGFFRAGVATATMTVVTTSLNISLAQMLQKCTQTGRAPDSRFEGRFRFLVALMPVRDLHVYAKHLFGAAKLTP